MTINQLILRSFKKNIKNYYLYVFALIFSVSLYFAFVTLQYDPAMDTVKGGVKGGASIRAASVLLVGIVTVFLVYANMIFIKRRSKEIGLFHLIGMTKRKIFRILGMENALLYFLSVGLGIFLGFSLSKLIMMILLKITGVNAVTTLHFSSQAFVQTLIVFTLIFVLILGMNALFIRKQTILSLFRVTSSAEAKVQKLSVWEMIMGILGIILIAFGYYISTKLFSGDFTNMTELFIAMIIILASVIIGTYFFYKGSVSFIFNLIRKKKDGYLNIREVLSLSSIMFRMKSNSFLLTIVTTVSALAIGLLSLSYISYYSAEKSAEDNVINDFAFVSKEDAQTFKDALKRENLPFEETMIEVVMVTANLKSIINIEGELLDTDLNKMELPVVSEKSVPGIDVSPTETVFTGYSDMLSKFMALDDSGNIELHSKSESIPLDYIGLRDEFIISWYFTNGGQPVAIVDDSLFSTLQEDLVPEVQRESSVFIGIEMKKEETIQQANDLFIDLGLHENYMNDSQLQMSTEQKQLMGLMMFIVGFLGLTFLITSGCILYFKQMDESEDEKSNYTILRKLGFTQGDLTKGIGLKQVFNFGIPLVIGLSHSYFAVQSGWFFFGAELWTPMALVMILYTGLYSIFGFLSVLNYKKVIRNAL
ncbi:ABC transporter permease [Robertmurraya korlensis]|uniref:FtsX-like permease family protein n=1 Tax=Robertmurraya korlensis TaxID=519977 RepID=UPI00203C6DBB|nr:ABC transporter permease [Robertmurraya korlensis]MCM3602981.1 ABC transporter permease [Robertmurraya korlensis]